MWFVIIKKSKRKIKEVLTREHCILCVMLANCVPCNKLWCDTSVVFLHCYNSYYSIIFTTCFNAFFFFNNVAQFMKSFIGHNSQEHSLE